MAGAGVSGVYAGEWAGVSVYAASVRDERGEGVEEQGRGMRGDREGAELKRCSQLGKICSGCTFVSCALMRRRRQLGQELGRAKLGWCHRERVSLQQTRLVSMSSLLQRVRNIPRSKHAIRFYQLDIEIRNFRTL